MKLQDLPPTELYVEIVRPMARFGLALQIYRRATDGRIWHAQADDKGDLGFVPIDNATYPDRPTLYLDDEVAHKLHKALAGEPIRLRGEAVNDHLRDVIDTRDRLWKQVEAGNDTMRNLVMTLAMGPERKSN